MRSRQLDDYLYWICERAFRMRKSEKNPSWHDDELFLLIIWEDWHAGCWSETQKAKRTCSLPGEFRFLFSALMRERTLLARANKLIQLYLGSCTYYSASIRDQIETTCWLNIWLEKPSRDERPWLINPVAASKTLVRRKRSRRLDRSDEDEGGDLVIVD